MKGKILQIKKKLLLNKANKKNLLGIRKYLFIFKRKQVFEIPTDLNMTAEIKVPDKPIEKSFIPNDISKVNQEMSSRASQSFLNDLTNKIDYSMYYK